ncbi:hypothetical protein FO519_005111 [Halicephalobus sp. NKZ332]|nr:hypothetical protein FO519_005111 [Halicephalobus sp. NKZ332]
MPRKKSAEPGMTAPGAPQPRARQRKKKEPANQIADIKMEMSQAQMAYEPQGMSNGIMVEDCGSYGHDFYYQHGGPTSTASGSMNNGYGPSSQSQGPPGSAQTLNQSYPDAENPQQSQQVPYNMNPVPVSSQAPSGMMSHPGPHPVHPPGLPNGVNPAVGQPQMMMRPMPPFPQPPLLEYRLMEMNKRMYSFNHQEYPIPPQDRLQWWEVFGQEFFEDDARFTITAYETPEVVRKYSIGRQLIAKFFRHLFETGVSELYFVPRGMASERSNHWGACAVEIESVAMLTTLDKPVPAKVQTDAKLFIEFGPFEEVFGYRIRQFHIELRSSQEFISQQVVMDNETQERVRQGLTKFGFTQKAINFLKLCVIMEPMQPIMQHCKAHPNVPPRDALKLLLFNYHQNRKQVQPPMGAPGMPPMPMPPAPNAMAPQPPVEEPAKKPARKRTRKPNNVAGGTTTPAKQRKGNSRASPTQASNNFPMNQNASSLKHGVLIRKTFQYTVGQYQEILVVGEPSLMGGDFGEEDERSISRIENTQFDGVSMPHGSIPGSAPMSVGLPTNGSTPIYSRQNSFNRGVEPQKIQQPQSVPMARAVSQSQLTMLQPPISNPQWNGMSQGNVNATLIAQPICDQ